MSFACCWSESMGGFDCGPPPSSKKSTQLDKRIQLAAMQSIDPVRLNILRKNSMDPSENSICTTISDGLERACSVSSTSCTELVTQGGGPTILAFMKGEQLKLSPQPLPARVGSGIIWHIQPVAVVVKKGRFTVTYPLYPNEFKIWEFDKAGAPDLKQQSGAEETQLE